MNIESVPSEAGPDLDGIEQGMSNDEVRFFTSLCYVQNDKVSEGTKVTPPTGGGAKHRGFQISAKLESEQGLYALLLTGQGFGREIASGFGLAWFGKTNT